MHGDLDDLSLSVAKLIAKASAQAIKERGVFHLALAGGDTPRRCYEKLRCLPIEWKHVEVYFGDERCLPDNDIQRNDTMAFNALLKHVAIAPASIHAIPAELGALAAAHIYAMLLKKVELDLVLLGMGEDGHTASLFPGNPATDSMAAVVSVFNAPKPPPERVSLGMSKLNAARQKIFLVAGAGKQDALIRIFQGEQLPAASIVAAEWHLDRTCLSDSFVH